MKPRRGRGFRTAVAALIIGVAALLFLGILFSLREKNQRTPEEAAEITSETEEAFDFSGEKSEAPPAGGAVLPVQETESIAETESEPETESVPSGEQRAEAILAQMATEEKVAQLFFVTPEQLTGVETVTAAGETTAAAFSEYPVGGIIYFDANLIDAEQTTQMLAAMQGFALQYSGLPVFLAVDEEGGRVRRIGNNPGFTVPAVSSMAETAALGIEGAARAGDVIGTYLSDLGFNVDFAPDADVLTNAENTVIGDRSFGSDPAEVAGCAWAFAEGLHAHQVLAAYKHFPGHGGTAEDSHTGRAYLYEDGQTLRTRELVPFADGAARGIDFIMVSHICLPELTGDETPACLSETVVTGLLREELGYDGIIITDSLQMKAISDYYSAGDAAVAALLAGNDMLLMPADFPAAYETVLSAAQSGTISEERLNESVRRILRVKLSLPSDADEE